MTPKEKAEELYDKFLIHKNYQAIARLCAIASVDDIINECTYWASGINIDWENGRFKYWQEVKQEIIEL